MLLNSLRPLLSHRRTLSAAALPVTPPRNILRWAIGGWCFFIAENTLLSENRALLISKLGDEERYRMLYGACSTTACASIAVGYHRTRGAAPLQWAASASPPGVRVATCFVLQAIGLAGLLQSVPKLQIPYGPADVREDRPHAAAKPWAVRCPFDFTHHDGLHGVQRVSRHAGLWSFAAICLGAAAVVPSVPQASCLAMPTLVAFLGGAHTDSRHRRGIGGELPASLEAMTSNVPRRRVAGGRAGRCYGGRARSHV